MRSARESFEKTLRIVCCELLRYLASSFCPADVSVTRTTRLSEPEGVRLTQPSEERLRASEVADGAVIRRCRAISCMVGRRSSIKRSVSQRIQTFGSAWASGKFARIVCRISKNSCDNSENSSVLVILIRLPSPRLDVPQKVLRRSLRRVAA